MSFIVVAGFLGYLMVRKKPSFLPSVAFAPSSELPSRFSNLTPPRDLPSFLLLRFSLWDLHLDSPTSFTLGKVRGRRNQRRSSASSQVTVRFVPFASQRAHSFLLPAHPSPSCLFVLALVGTYFLSLMICDITPTLAAVMNIRWAVDVSSRDAVSLLSFSSRTRSD